MDQLLNYMRGFSFGQITYPNGGLFGPILRPYLALIFVRDGVCTLRADRVKVKVASGQVGIAAGNARFDFDYQRNISTSVVWCEGFLPQLATAAFDEMNGEYAPIDAPERITELLSLGLGTGYESGPELNAMRDSIGAAVVRSFLFEVRKHSTDQKLPKAVNVARRYIKENLDNEHLSVRLVAEQAAISQQHLISSFKAHLGTTPSRYLWRLRAGRARQLLIHSQLSQSEIAFKCGYKSLPHFSRSIKSHFGMTPLALRQDMGFTPPSDTEGSVEDVYY